MINSKPPKDTKTTVFAIVPRSKKKKERDTMDYYKAIMNSSRPQLSYMNYIGKFNLISAGFNLAAQFIGSFTRDAFMSSKGNLIFVISDTKTTRSLLYYAVDDKARVVGMIKIPYGSTVQNYIWTH